jgi:hypothetical protein
MLLARVTVLLLSLLVIGMIWQAGALRERLGWSSNLGNIVWWILGVPGFLLILLCQILAYRKIAAASPFDDGIVAAALIVQVLLRWQLFFITPLSTKTLESSSPLGEGRITRAGGSADHPDISAD